MKILLCGISVRAMAESAVRSGYFVVALDAFGDQDLRALTESHSLHRDFDSAYSTKALFKASRSLAFDALAYTSNLENHPKILKRFEAKHRLVGNSHKAVKAVRHWPTLIAKLKQAGFAVPETVFAGDNWEIDNHRKWVVKPLLSGGGHGIAFASRDKPAPGSLFQEYIPGKPCSVSFVSNGHQCVLLGVTEQLIGLHQFGSRGFRYCGNILPLPELLDPVIGGNILEQLNRLAAFLTQEYGLTGLNGVDFILNGDRVYLTEVNPRYSASMELIERAYTLPIFHLHTQGVLDGKLPEFNLKELLRNSHSLALWRTRRCVKINPIICEGGSSSRRSPDPSDREVACPDGSGEPSSQSLVCYSRSRKFFGKVILFAEREAIVPDTRGWAAEDIRDIPEPGEKISAGSPICTFLTGRPTYNETLADLTDRAKELKEEIYGKTDSDPDNRTFHQTGYRNIDWKRETRI